MQKESSRSQRSPAKIRQQGFDEHAQGFDLHDNPYKKSTWPNNSRSWAEGWKIREAQAAMFDDVNDTLDDIIDDTDNSFESVSECPHCGMKIKVTLE